MSGSTIGGVVGGIVGFFFGNPQLGFMIGSAIGGYVDPVKVEGPRLKDAAQQTSNDGVPIPFGYGTYPVKGNVIWTDELKEIKKTERQGKGGPKVTSYTYTRSYAIGICEGPIAGLVMVKRNGKVVYDARDQPTLVEWLQRVDFGEGPATPWGGSFMLNLSRTMQAWNARWQNKVATYLGSEEQLPDPTMEAVLGAGKVPAHRGLAYIVVKDEDLTELGGAIPQYEFVVSVCGTEIEVPLDDARSWVAVGSNSGGGSVGEQLLPSPNGRRWDAPLETGIGATCLLSSRSRMIGYDQTSMSYSDDRGLTWHPVADPPNASGAAKKGVYSNGLFLVPCGSYGLSVSSGGENWTHGLAMEAGTSPFAVAVHGLRIVSVGQFGRVVTSADGEDFSLIYTTIPGFLAPSSACVKSAGGVLVAGGQGHTMAWSYSGEAWTEIESPFENGTGPTNSVSVHRIEASVVPATGLHWVAISRIETTSTDAPVGQVAHSADGISWSMAPSLEFNPNDLHSVGGYFLAVGDGGRMASWQPGDAAWTEITNGFSKADAFAIWAVTTVHRQLSTPIPDAPGYDVDEDGVISGPPGTAIELCYPTLGSIVANLLQREGLTPDDYDVSDLTDPVAGYRVASEAGADAMIAPLMQGFFFDSAEYDGKIRFRKRGGDSEFVLGPDDYLDMDGDAVTETTVQEAELLRRVTVGYLDPMTEWTPTTQKYERRSGTVEARGEASTELPIVCSGTFAARVAEKRVKVAWSEPRRQEFGVPALKWARLSPADVGTLYKRDGSFVRVRVMSREEDSGRLLIESSQDSQAAYIGTVTGVAPPPPQVIDPPLVGPTQLAVMDLPALHEDHDRLGVYVAAGGLLRGWNGAEIQLSTDGGVTFEPYAQVKSESTIGATTTALAAGSAEWPTAQTLTVRLPAAPESITFELLQRYRNRAALLLDDGSWEVLQFQAVAPNSDGTYTLSGLVRGRYATSAGAASVGARFVLLDESVQFVPAESWALTADMQVRAVSYGTDPDAAQAVPVTFAGQSAREWPPHYVRAERSGGDVIVTWIGRGRIGAETVARNSQWFTGYRVTFSDGHTADVTGTTYTYAAAPDPVTVSVAALNSITGAGPASEAATA